MNGKRIIYASIFIVVVALSYFGWKLTARGAYESAEYSVLQSDGPFEVREYEDLMMATTNMKLESQGDDGSFMRLFQYISGANNEEQKIAMTTPVFMEGEAYDAPGEMGFVIPEELVKQQIPEPSNESVRIRKRAGGRFAVIRFAGRMNSESARTAEERLHKWMKNQNLIRAGDPEFAGYDPPWTPGPLRRNEILIRLK